MAVDDLEIEYHLTSRGWVEGTHKFFGNVDGEKIESPQDTVETWVKNIYQRSGWSGEEISWKCIWVDSKMDEKKRNELRNEFPKPS
ncbi:MAG: hypothetical protein KAR07_10225 [Spirochaetes bacterium]|nr:hypothetical protein [Candidatus Auribacterota bacterium]MCK5268537.1 hypothetical protein [Spirochaetota bacterium]